MEEVEKYYVMAKELMPKNLAPFVNFVLSPRTEDCYSLFRGVRYRDIPDRKYDFVFVDGPSYKAPSDGATTFNFDYIYVVKKSIVPVFAITDKRVSACYVFQKVFGTLKAKYDAVTRVGKIGPYTKHDLRDFNPNEASAAFAKSFRIFGNTKLDIEF